MGTRSLTYFYSKDTDENPFTCFYRQFDGYPSGHGADLAGILVSGTKVNGIPVGGKPARYFNGMGCLAAQVIDDLKDGAGNIYIEPAELNMNCGEEYRYHIFPNKVIIQDYYRMNIFEGSWKEFYNFCASKEIA